MKPYQIERRQFILGGAALLLCESRSVFALSISQISQGDAASGLTSLLGQAAEIAVKQLGVAGGFNNDSRVHIKLPQKLDSANTLLRRLGMSKQLDQLENNMNSAAEQAVALAKPILTNAISNMTFQDAKSIVTGGDRAGTAYLERSSRSSLFSSFQPVVKNVVGKTSVATQYNALASKVSALGMTDKDFSIETYVTDKALDGLFNIMGEKESYIRNNPAEAAGSITKKILEVLSK